MKHKRINKLVDKPFQLKLASYFVGIVLVALLFQFVLFASSVSGTAAAFSEVSDGLYAQFRDDLVRSLFFSMVLVLPLTLGVGILVTFRVAGPIYRFGVFLREVADGAAPGDCKLREGDELQELCTLLNEATAPLRKREGQPAESERTAA
jgi:nitrogen fixation/metabolism regulation signal transduction histidine kinase